MSNAHSFAHKHFNGQVYTFDHLKPLSLAIPVKTPDHPTIPLHVQFGCHCFTEGFDDAIHTEHHRYTHQDELRAFDVQRYQLSLALPTVIEQMIVGRVYRADRSYTYLARIALPPAGGQQPYSVFFSLEKDKYRGAPALSLYVKSAYSRGLAAPVNGQSWRFVALAGETAGLFTTGKSKKR
jgi:hypothetical protein